MAAIVAGSKVSTKLDVLTSLSSLCDQLIVGGGIANTFLAAAGFPVGKSLCEHDLLDTARATKFPLPLSATAHQMFMQASTAGYAKEDDSAVIKIFPGITLPSAA